MEMTYNMMVTKTVSKRSMSHGHLSTTLQQLIKKRLLLLTRLRILKMKKKMTKVAQNTKKITHMTTMTAKITVRRVHAKTKKLRRTMLRLTGPSPKIC